MTKILLDLSLILGGSFLIGAETNWRIGLAVFILTTGLYRAPGGE